MPAHDKLVLDRLGPVGGSDGSGSDSSGTNGSVSTGLSSSTPKTTIPQSTVIPSIIHSTHTSHVPNDSNITHAKTDNLQSQPNKNVALQSQIDHTASAIPQEAIIDDAHLVSLNNNKGPTSGKVPREQLYQATVGLETDNTSANVTNVDSESAMDVDNNTNVLVEISGSVQSQKRVQRDPPSDSDVSVSKKLKEDKELGHRMGKKSGHSDTEVQMAADPSMDIYVNTELHKEYQTSFDTLSPLSLTEEEYIGSGSVKRLSDSGYNTTGVNYSQENLSFRSRDHTHAPTLKDVETFSEDSLDNLDEASDQMDETNLDEVGDSDSTSNIEQLKLHFQQQNELEEKDEIGKEGKTDDSEDGHLSEDSLEESVSRFSSPDNFYLDSSTPQVNFDREQSQPERFTQSLPVSFVDQTVPNVPKLYQGLDYPEQLLERHWQPHTNITEAINEHVNSDGGDSQNSEEQLGSVDPPPGGTKHVQEISSNEVEGQICDINCEKSEEVDAQSTQLTKSDKLTDKDQGTAVQLSTVEGQSATGESGQDATAADSHESLDENDNSQRIPSQNVSPKHTVTRDNYLDQDTSRRAFDTESAEARHDDEDHTDLLSLAKEATLENSNVSYVSGIGDGDHVNVMAMDGKDGEMVYLIVDSDSALAEGGDAPMPQCLSHASAEEGTRETLVSTHETESLKVPEGHPQHR